MRGPEVVVAGLLLTLSTVFAQGSGGTITGTISDPGGIVAGATIQAKHEATGIVRTAASSRTGDFTLTELPAGTYEITVPALGYRTEKFVQEDVVLAAGQTLRLDIALVLGNLGVLGDDNAFLVIRNKYAGLEGPAPRGADGRPDLSGTWNATAVVSKQPPAMLPWAEAEQKSRLANAFRDLPSAYCLPGEPFPYAPLLYKNVHTPALLVQLFEERYRQVFLDGRDRPGDLDPAWTGYSIGRWDGDVLVVETAGFNGKTWLPDGVPHTDTLRVVERYRRPDLARLEIEVVIEDPATFTKPWELQTVWELAPGEELLESVCNENNKYRENIGNP